MRNIGKITSSLCCCLFVFIMTTTGQDRVDYYLVSCKEYPNRKIFSAFKRTMENDGRAKVRQFKYSVPGDSISLMTKSYFRKNDQALIRYAGQSDTVGQVYLKLQPDTSFVYEFDDSVSNEIFGTVYRYLGKEVLLKEGKEREYYKFRGEQGGIAFDAYFDDNLILERQEWMIENYLHYIFERLEPGDVPKGFREKVESYVDEEEKIVEEPESRDVENRERAGNYLEINRIFVVCVVLVFLLAICTYILIRNKKRGMK